MYRFLHKYLVWADNKRRNKHQRLQKKKSTSRSTSMRSCETSFASGLTSIGSKLLKKVSPSALKVNFPLNDFQKSSTCLSINSSKLDQIPIIFFSV